MGFLDKLERKFRGFGIPHITLYLVAGQGLFFLFLYSGKADLTRALLVPALVLEGEWWRLFSFLFIPPASNVFFIFFALYFFYLMGQALESHWGTFRYTVFLLTGYVLTVGASLLTPYTPATNIFIGGSVFLAFAFLFPEFELLIFFILPVRIKWLALLAWIGYGWSFVSGSWTTRLMIAASVGNVLIFFGRDILWRVRSGGRKVTQQARTVSGSRKAFHTCAVCGKTDISHPDMEFRYCPVCGGLGYCMDHISGHEHRTNDKKS
jgi:membrane protein implicated in regulation of membrane protease activity